jgi:endonuclease-3
MLSEFKVDIRHWLILQGRYTCTVRKLRCGSCLIEDLYEYSPPKYSPPKHSPPKESVKTRK